MLVPLTKATFIESGIVDLPSPLSNPPQGRTLAGLTKPDPHHALSDRPSVPRHIAIIMDGNGRWANQRGLPRIEGHRRGWRPSAR